MTLASLFVKAEIQKVHNHRCRIADTSCLGSSFDGVISSIIPIERKDLFTGSKTDSRDVC